ncbi:MAG: hypothetical protein WC599_14090 [Bacteroidales bacterium]
MKTINYLIIGCLVLFSYCKKVEVPDDTPRCIKKEIRKIMREKKCDSDSPAKVFQYEYKGESVFLFPGPYCISDGCSILYDSKCNIICYPTGGISGKGCDTKCSDFLQVATNEKLIWEDAR